MNTSEVTTFPETDFHAVKQVFEALDGRTVLRDSEPVIDIMLRSIPVFVYRGVASTTVNHLIEAAGVSRRTFYKYYSGKSAVLEGIYCAGAQLFLSKLKTIVEYSRHVDELVEDAVGLFFDHHTSIGPLILLLEEEAMRTSSPLAGLRQDAYDRIAKQLRDGMLAISGSAPDLMVFYTLIWSMEAASLNLMRDRRYTIDDVSQVRQVVIHIVKRTLGNAEFDIELS